MAFLTAPDGTRLHYAVEGDGPSLVLHLGAGCDSELWRAAGYLEPLAKTYRCILFDHRGHGRSDRPRGAFIKSPLVLPRVEAFLAEHLSSPVAFRDRG